MSLQVGEQAPDCTLYRLDGSPVPLSAFRAPALLLVFLRHLA